MKTDMGSCSHFHKQGRQLRTIGSESPMVVWPRAVLVLILECISLSRWGSVGDVCYI
jgi:hypothetical protein